ncbi:MAG: hypothetical protein WBD40_24200 [Tepidisphaeraceae bacterium]
MQRSRHVLAAVVVATALCADRATAAAPQARPQVGQIARNIASKLTVSFRRVVPTVRFVENRREGTCDTIPRPPAEAGSPTVWHASSASPFRFRLPPPTL